MICTDLSGKAPHRQVDMDRVMTLRCLGGLMVITQARNARDVVSHLGMIFPIFIMPPPTPMTGVMTRILYKLIAVWLLKYSKYIVCM